MRVVLVGGGIGGMAAAVGLRRAGLRPLVLERAPEIREVGAGFNMAPNAVRALRHLGCGDLLDRRGARSRGVLISTLEEGEPLVYAEEEVHHQIHRADLLDGLRAMLPDECVRLNSTVTGFEQGRDGVLVHLDDGDVIEGDVLVGADGIRSTVRDILVGPQEARFTGYVAWRAVFPADRLPDVPHDRNWGWAGPGRSAFFYPVRSNELLNFVANVPAVEVERESWSLSGDVADLRRSMAGSCAMVQDIVSAIDEAFLTGLYFRDPLPTWTSGRVTLLGDAAHAAGPFLGQGAAMALEDAVTLAACLGRVTPGDAAAALQEYEARRRPRATAFQIAVRNQETFLHERDRATARARNLRARGAQRLDPMWGGGVGFLIRFDPVSALDLPIDQLNRLASVPQNDRHRPEARQAFDLWRSALSIEDRCGDWRGERAGYDSFLSREFPPGRDLSIAPVDLGGVPALDVRPDGMSAGPIVFHLHGGGYVFGSAAASTALAGRLARAVNGTGVTVDYRLAPEHGSPAALEDAITAYTALSEAHPDRPIVLSGEDAGGGLAVALAVALRERRTPQPSAIHLISPFVDLSLTAESIDSNAGRDPWYSRDSLVVLAGSYLQAMDPRDEHVSPLFADLAGLPPLLIHAAADEALADDATRLAAAAQAAGVPVICRLADDSVHSYPLFDFLPETTDALHELTQFCSAVLSTAPLTEEVAP